IMKPDAKVSQCPQSAGPNSLKLLEGFASRMIRRKARQLVGKAGFTSSDHDAIEQELVMKLLKHAAAFDPAISDWHAFVATVVERCAANLLRNERAQKRDCRRVCSLSVIIACRDNGTLELGETISQRDYDRRRQRCPKTEEELAELASDIAEVLAKVPAELRELAEQLKSRSLSEIARDRSVPRTTLYRAVRQLRRRFESPGLRRYL